ncbi:phosphoribosylamine-glycine ligase [Legionella rubrilucens]|uniref:Phosphoribosylamine--glycine ligase n=1 Tax=Legionella rubrilucens TaxID=458 RepID=A0A0W0XQM1_9GAMM|nr:phosphoribosylamine--glycine ligase [Legionella rubrilucens]KTD47025.1 phosphoribosylamine-glycine ligase [Legionella rubrilucens]
MNILVIGSGAREQALIHAMHRSPLTPLLFCYGTSFNPGIGRLTSHYACGDITESEAVVTQALAWGIELAIIGPEAPLEKGLADALWQAGIAVIGPRQAAARIETSKQFARNLMKKHAIAGLPAYSQFDSMQGIEDYLRCLGEGQYVIKADGLMGGKGVKVAGEHLHLLTEALSYCQSLLAEGQTLIIEEKLIGEEFSFMAFADGKSLVPMPLVQDHKRAFEGDKGPNTGGMGSYSAADHGLPFLSTADIEAAWAINQSVYHALQLELQQPYIGFWYGSFMATARGVSVIEFNARLGDPESLNVLPLLESDLVDHCIAMVQGELNAADVRFAPYATVCKYAVPQGYPDAPLKQFPIDCSLIQDSSHFYLAGVHQQGDQWVATGSRTAAYVGIGATLAEAEKKAESEIARVAGPLYHRRDIGTPERIEARMAHMNRLRQS